MEIEKLFNEWLIAYRAKGGKITVAEEELFADFFRWLKSKAAEQSVQLTGLESPPKCTTEKLCPVHNVWHAKPPRN